MKVSHKRFWCSTSDGPCSARYRVLLSIFLSYSNASSISQGKDTPSLRTYRKTSGLLAELTWTTFLFSVVSLKEQYQNEFLDAHKSQILCTLHHFLRM